MSYEADDVRLNVQLVAEKAREANIALVNANRALEEMRNLILLLDLTEDSRHIRSAARFGLTVGRDIPIDLETLLMIETEMREWLGNI